MKWEENQASVVSQNSKEDGILKREESILRLQLSGVPKDDHWIKQHGDHQ